MRVTNSDSFVGGGPRKSYQSVIETVHSVWALSRPPSETEADRARNARDRRFQQATLALWPYLGAPHDIVQN